MRLTYEEFKEAILNHKESFLPEEMKGADIFIEQVNKLNHSYEALLIRIPGSNVAPSIPLDEFYKKCDAIFPEQVFRELKDLLSNLELEKGYAFQNSGELLSDYNAVKDSLFIRCSNSVVNFDVLRSYPHTQLGDLAFTAHIGMKWEDGGTPDYSTPVTDQLLDGWEISKKELFKDAVENSVKRLPVLCNPLVEMIGGAGFMEDNGLYVLTNTTGHYGAAAMLYPGVLDGMHEQIGNFYMLPSSVHEILLLPEDTNVSISDLERMVREVNRNVLQDEDFLSDVVYHYDGKKKLIEPVRDYEKRCMKEQTIDVRPAPEQGVQPDQKPQIPPAGPQANSSIGLSM